MRPGRSTIGHLPAVEPEWHGDEGFSVVVAAVSRLKARDMLYAVSPAVRRGRIGSEEGTMRHVPVSEQGGRLDNGKQPLSHSRQRRERETSFKRRHDQRKSYITKKEPPQVGAALSE